MQSLNKKLLSKIAGRYQKTKDRKALVNFSVAIKKVDNDKQIITGQVYAPNILDTHFEMMLPEDVEKMCHHWTSNGLHSFDIMHNNKKIRAVTTESWIARGHPEYDEGSWVMSIHVQDSEVWKDVRSGKYGGFSVEAWAQKVEAVVEYTYSPIVFGMTKAAKDGHRHLYVAFINKNGVVVGGFTSVENGHKHSLKHGTRTEEAEDHAHGFELP